MQKREDTVQAEQLSEALVLLRELHGKTQAEVARGSELQAPNLCRMERGYRMPSIPTVLGVLASLGEDLVSLQFALDRLAGLSTAAAALKSLRTLVRLTYLSTGDRGGQTAAFLERLERFLKNVGEDEEDAHEGEADEAT